MRKVIIWRFVSGNKICPIRSYKCATEENTQKAMKQDIFVRAEGGQRKKEMPAQAE